MNTYDNFLRQYPKSEDYNLENFNGILKTHELEIQQDKKIEKNHVKEKSVVVVAKGKKFFKENGSDDYQIFVKTERLKAISEDKVKSGKGKA